MFYICRIFRVKAFICLLFIDNELVPFSVLNCFINFTYSSLVMILSTSGSEELQTQPSILVNLGSAALYPLATAIWVPIPVHVIVTIPRHAPKNAPWNNYFNSIVLFMMFKLKGWWKVSFVVKFCYRKQLYLLTVCKHHE